MREKSCDRLFENRRRRFVVIMRMVRRSHRRTQSLPPGAKPRIIMPVLLGLMTVILFAFPSVRMGAEVPAARRFVAHALALRAAGVAGEKSAAEFLAGVPGIGLGEQATLTALWTPFFANAIVKVGRLTSSGPAALYYNPLLDVAVLTLWEKTGTDYRVVSVRALPGERLTDPNTAARVRPSWMTGESPMVALVWTTNTRLEAFRLAHPAGSREPARSATTFAADAADFRAVLPRLLWNAAQRAQWTDEAQPWLRPILAEVEGALMAGDPAALAAVAPDTDPETASVLSDLPAGFTENLALDMTIQLGEKDQLLIGSLPNDGDVYLLILCQRGEAACTLRRFVLISLLE